MAMLLAPFRYLKVHHPIKRRWDAAAPLVMGALLTALLFLWPSVPSPYGAGGYLASLQTLFSILGGFFVAALTLLATAQSPSLSQPIGGWPATTYDDEVLPLSRQRFLCLLFGYLAFAAFALYAIGFMAMLLAPGLAKMIVEPYRTAVSAAFMFLYNFWLSHMAIATMIGLYYFTDRLQRTEVEFERDATPAE